MAKLRHLAIATDDPDRTAQFYIDVLEFEKVRDRPKASGDTVTS